MTEALSKSSAPLPTTPAKEHPMSATDELDFAEAPQSFEEHLDEIICDPTFAARPYWMTAKSDIIPIDKMEVSHLNNVLAMLARRNLSDHAINHAIDRELKFRQLWADFERREYNS